MRRVANHTLDRSFPDRASKHARYMGYIRTFAPLFALLYLFWCAQPLPLAYDPVKEYGLDGQLVKRQLSVVSPYLNATTSNTTFISVAACVFPISGIYTRLQRILFYVIIAFVFLFSVHDWLTAVAFAFLLTYSTSAVIHAILLGTQRYVGHDLDSLPIIAVLSTSFVAGICFLAYTPRVLHRHASKLFAFWTGSAAFGLAFAVAGWIRTSEALAASAFYINTTNSSWTSDVCRTNSQQVLFHAPMDPMNLHVFGQGVNISEHLIVAWTASSFPRLSVQLTQVGAQNDASSYLPANYLWFYAGYILIVGPTFYGCIVASSFYPRKSRHMVFSFLTSKEARKKVNTPVLLTLPYVDWIYLLVQILSMLLGPPYRYVLHDRRNESFDMSDDVHPTKPMLLFARILALMWYAWAALAYLLWPAFILIPIVFWERTITPFPESEAAQLIGQWSPWVSFGLAVSVGLFSRVRSMMTSGDSSHRIINLGDLASNEHPEKQCHWGMLNFNPRRLPSLRNEWNDVRSWWRDPVNNIPQDDRKGIWGRSKEDTTSKECTRASREPIPIYPDYDTIWHSMSQSLKPSATSTDYISFPHRVQLSTAWDYLATQDAYVPQEFLSKEDFDILSAHSEESRCQKESLEDSISDLLAYKGFELT